MKKRRDLKLYWHSNGHWTYSGYGVFTRHLLFRMRDDGWPIAEGAFYGLEGVPTVIDGIKVYPKMADVWGADMMVNHAANFGANVVFSMQDIWPLDPNWLSKIKMWIPYLPIDKDPAPQNVLSNLRLANRIITFSDFGRKALQKEGFTSTFITEGTDVEVFKPMDKLEARKSLGLSEDKFIVGMVGANKENPPRKGFEEAMNGFAEFAKTHPEAIMFFHVQQRSPGGFPIMEYAKYLGMGDKCFFIDDYTAMHNSSSEVIMKEYNAFDVLLHPSQTEGFGLCIIESQACGTPVIIQNSHSMPELIIEGETGWGVKTARVRFTQDNSLVNVADSTDIAAKLTIAYDALKKDEKKVSKACRDNVVDNFNMDTLYRERWLPYLEDLQEEILGPIQETKKAV